MVTGGFTCTLTVSWAPGTADSAAAGRTIATLPARMIPPVAADTLAVIGAGALPVMEAGSTGGATGAFGVVGTVEKLKPVGTSATPVFGACGPTTVAPPLAEVLPAVTDADPDDSTLLVPGAPAAGLLGDPPLPPDAVVDAVVVVVVVAVTPQLVVGEVSPPCTVSGALAARLDVWPVAMTA